MIKHKDTTDPEEHTYFEMDHFTSLTVAFLQPPVRFADMKTTARFSQLQPDLQLQSPPRTINIL